MMTVGKFLHTKARTLACRAARLTRLAPGMVGIQGTNRRYAPSVRHFDAANKRLAQIAVSIRKRIAFMKRRWSASTPNQALVNIAMVEREVDRARRAFGLFFEVFSQRGSSFAPALAAHDAVATDCYAAVTQRAPEIFGGRLLKPLTYMEHGYSPATMRRGVTLARLLGERNPFPLIRIPWDRDNPWQAVFLHEVAHNLQADLNIWNENKKSLMRRLVRTVGDPFVVSTYGRWHKEIFGDLAALLLGGSAAAWGMADFLAHPRPRTLTFKSGGVHPTGYLRVMLLAEMLKRMGLERQATSLRQVWQRLFDPSRGHRLPAPLLRYSPRAIPHVVDEIAFQPRRNLGQRALADVIRFTRDDERRITAGARYMQRGIMPTDLPPRFVLSAGRQALAAGAAPAPLSALMIDQLAHAHSRQRPRSLVPVRPAA